MTIPTVDPGIIGSGVGAVLIWEILRRFIGVLFDRTTDPPFITKDECARCSARELEAKKRIEAEIAKINASLEYVKGVLMVVAVHAGISPEKFKDLAR